MERAPEDCLVPTPASEPPLPAWPELQGGTESPCFQAATLNHPLRQHHFLKDQRSTPDTVLHCKPSPKGEGWGVQGTPNPARSLDSEPSLVPRMKKQEITWPRGKLWVKFKPHILLRYLRLNYDHVWDWLQNDRGRVNGNIDETKLVMS